MPSKSVSLKLSSNDPWSTNISQQAIEQIKVSTCRYAKRQRTWFRKDSRIHWIDANHADFDRMLNESIDLIRAGNST